MKQKRLIFAWHHYLGLLVGIFLLLMSITGSMLAFAEEIEKAELEPFVSVSNPSGKYSVDTSFRNVAKLYPGWEIRLYDQPGKNEALVYELRQKDSRKKLFVHPLSGKILHVVENANSFWHRRLLLFHYTLFAGTIGKCIVFIVGLLFLGSIVTGLILYRKAIGKVLRFKTRLNRRTSRAFYSSLHRILGVWSLLFNLLIVVTGLVMSGQVATNALKQSVTTNQISGAKPISVDSVSAVVRKSYPSFETHLIRIRPGAELVQVLGRFDTDPFYYGNYYSGFVIHGLNFKIENVQLMREMPVMKKLMTVCGPLHFGNYGGVAIKFLYSFFGIMPAILSITGFIIWRKRKQAAAFHRTMK